ncbi:MAG: type II toxin-antitoxin system RelE/ParE family toxin [Deltaproteobacteria bacterium]|nr:type II toxin-antitoxin system RelE/ParE family toxin [Deltaproteobacteria bacterium]
MSYKLFVPDEIVLFIRGLHPLIKKRVKSALKEICMDPYCGKTLKDEFDGLHSFRIKRFRIIYQIFSRNRIGIVAIGPRKYIYEETYRLISSTKDV